LFFNKQQKPNKGDNMKIDIKTPRNATQLKEYVLQRVRSEFSKYSYKIDHVAVRLVDVNGPKGGKDKECRINIDISGRKDDIYDSYISSEWEEAIDWSIDRSVRELSRKMELSSILRGDNNL